MSNTPAQAPYQQAQQFYGNMYPQTQVVYSESLKISDHVQQPAIEVDQDLTVQESSAWVQESDIRYKDGVVAIFLNFFLPGLGHFLLGQKVKGIIFLLAIILYSILASVLSIVLVGFLFFIPLTYVWIVQIYDGYWLVERVKKGYPIMKGEHSSIWVKYTGAGLFVKPSFASGSDSAPEEWHVKVTEVPQML
jgi:TM2 domain-containing membrane protein YozV